MPEDKKGDLTVYYLSPRILTRTRMTPERLKSAEFRITNIGSLRSDITRLYDSMHLTDRKITSGQVWRYDFRLCISFRQNDVFFSSDAKAAFADGGTFALSSGEERDVLVLFGKLDALPKVRKAP